VDTSSQECVYFTLGKFRVTVRIKLVRPLSTVDNTRGYARVSHSRQWSSYNLSPSSPCPIQQWGLGVSRKEKPYPPLLVADRRTLV